MKSKVIQILLSLVALAPVLFISLGFLGGKVFENSNSKPTGITTSILEVHTSEKMVRVPLLLVIPSIDLSASIQNVDLDQDGKMEVPNNPMEVGWLDLSTPVGSVGSAVVSGHLNQSNGDSAVFAKLHKLKSGDDVIVYDNLGESITFIVRESRLFDPGYADEVFGNGDETHLNLVTCDGTWDNKTKSYNKRLVVFTDLK